jgi:hypothetical protein
VRHLSIVLRVLAALIALLSAGPVASRSQESTPKSDELALAVADAMKANTMALNKYSWRSKASLTKDGELMATTVTELRFNTEGKLEATTIGGESQVEKKPGLRGRQQAKRMEDFQKYLEGVLDHSFKYIFMSKGTLVDVFDRAQITRTADAVDVSAGSLFVKGDELFMSVDPASHLTNKMTFKTTLEEDTITGVVMFARIENGPNKPTRWEIEIPTQAIKIVSETYDWIEQK